MKPRIRTVFAAVVMAAGMAWATLQGLARAIRSRRGHAGGPSTTRRRYVFGGISRTAFDAAMRKRPRRRSRSKRTA
jgi:hypothetical protein